MKKIMLIILISLSLSAIFAQATQLNLNVTGRSFYNSIKASSFDIENPANQPLCLLYSSTKQMPIHNLPEFSVNITLKWNGDNDPGNVNVPFSVNAISILNTPSGSINFTNRQVLIENGNAYFNEPDSEISLDQLTSNTMMKMHY